MAVEVNECDPLRRRYRLLDAHHPNLLEPVIDLLSVLVSERDRPRIVGVDDVAEYISAKPTDVVAKGEQQGGADTLPPEVWMHTGRDKATTDEVRATSDPATDRRIFKLREEQQPSLLTARISSTATGSFGTTAFLRRTQASRSSSEETGRRSAVVPI